jgi:hypothetical protein
MPPMMDFFGTPPLAAYLLGLHTRLLLQASGRPLSCLWLGDESSRDLRENLRGVDDALSRFSVDFPRGPNDRLVQLLARATDRLREVDAVYRDWRQTGRPAYEDVLALELDRLDLPRIVAQVDLGCQELKERLWWGLGLRVGDCFAALGANVLDDHEEEVLSAPPVEGRPINEELRRLGEEMALRYISRLKGGLGALVEFVVQLPAQQVANVRALVQVQETVASSGLSPCEVIPHLAAGLAIVGPRVIYPPKHPPVGSQATTFKVVSPCVSAA